jgi:cytochrome P450
VTACYPYNDFMTDKPPQKARRQIMLSRKRPSDEAKIRDETTILDHLVHSPVVERELGNGGFARPAQLIQQAGAHNVSHTLSTIAVHLLQDLNKLASLRSELDAIWKRHEAQSTTPSWIELEKAPYLSACVTEGLR